MTLVRWNPRREMDTFQREVSRLFGGPNARDIGAEGLGNCWTPAVDIFEDDDNYMISMALPGLDQSEIKVHVENNTLTISGERKLAHEDKRENYARVEQVYGEFERAFKLPGTIDTGTIEAKMDKGVLNVTLPKREETKPKAIEVKVH